MRAEGFALRAAGRILAALKPWLSGVPQFPFCTPSISFMAASPSLDVESVLFKIRLVMFLLLPALSSDGAGFSFTAAVFRVR